MKNEKAYQINVICTEILKEENKNQVPNLLRPVLFYNKQLTKSVFEFIEELKENLRKEFISSKQFKEGYLESINETELQKLNFEYVNYLNSSEVIQDYSKQESSIEIKTIDYEKLEFDSNTNYNTLDVLIDVGIIKLQL